MFSDPVFGDNFFGRQEITDLLLKRATALKAGYRQNVALIGHRQLGKTSVLRHFLYCLKDPQILCIYVEIKFQALDYFVDQFIRSLLYHCLDGQGGQACASEPLSSLMEKAGHCIPKTVHRIAEITQLLRQRHAEAAYSKLFELTSVIKEETGKNCVVVLDEFHRLGEFGIRNAFSDFGKRIMIQKDTMYLLASSSFSASRKILAEKLALLFGNFERIYLEPFDFETSFDFLDRKLSPVTMDKTLQCFAVALTDGHPFFLDTLTLRMRELASAKDERAISKGTLCEALLKLLFESQGVWNQYFLKLISRWMRPDSRGSHILILTALARGANKLKDIARDIRRTAKETSGQLQELMENELIVKSGVFYRFHNKIFKFWLKEVYERKELAIVSASSGKAEFLERVNAVVDEYGKWLKMDIGERVMGLLALFNNEIVELGEKKRRLPHFTELIKVSPEKSADTKGCREILARGRGRCWICKIVEEKVTEKQVLDLVNAARDKKEPPTKVLLALRGMEENARLLAKEEKILTLGLSRINMLMDIYGRSPIVHADSRLI